MTEIEDLRAQLMEASALYEASRKREARTRHDSHHDPNSILDDAKRELYKVIHSINYWYKNNSKNLQVRDKSNDTNMFMFTRRKNYWLVAWASWSSNASWRLK